MLERNKVYLNWPKSKDNIVAFFQTLTETKMLDLKSLTQNEFNKLLGLAYTIGHNGRGLEFLSNHGSIKTDLTKLIEDVDARSRRVEKIIGLSYLCDSLATALENEINKAELDAEENDLSPTTITELREDFVDALRNLSKDLVDISVRVMFYRSSDIEIDETSYPLIFIRAIQLELKENE